MPPLWTALACLLSLFLGMTLMYVYRRRLPQHAGAGEGATNVWQLIDHVAAEATRNTVPTGKHHLREPREPAHQSALEKCSHRIHTVVTGTSPASALSFRADSLAAASSSSVTL
ncbi:hypothetical protein [Saccharopolyspora spinosa]|uniref:Uncharacterized protein n=1 Tax=Saccharopolyspora spinosa TaxID=60894 RepID=A0A2N3XY76_SACSN|nr:hypothetical protein [Saccharopolyspora spinosa]PKW15579.1 hypothetical protein A8926_3310 [Saccharopolyspora spinosa]